VQGYGIITISSERCASFLLARQGNVIGLTLRNFLPIPLRQQLAAISLLLTKHCRNMKIIRLLCVLFCLLCSLFSQRSYSDTLAIDEYKIKAGYLYNFTKFITWSAENSETFNICILGNDPFGELIDPIEQRTAFNQPIKLFRLTVMSKEPHCHIVYMSAGISAKSIGTNVKNTLTVGENTLFVGQGGMIAFINKDDRIKLQINLKLLQQSGLKISAKLLEVSEVVGGNGD
jgi:hypothetical protein